MDTAELRCTEYIDKVKLIVLDLDDTTLKSDGSLSLENEKALRHAIASGINVVIASGRAFSTIPKSIFKIDEIQYAVTSNGASIYHMQSGQCIHAHKLESASVKKIMDIIEYENVAYEAFIDGNAYADNKYLENPVAYGCSMELAVYVKNTRTGVDNIKQYIFDNAKRLDSIDIITRVNEQKNKLMVQFDLLRDEIYITSSTPYLIEISFKDSGKASGVKYIQNLLGIRPEETVAFGNADNDAEMLRMAGLGVAVMNASPKCKECSDIITLSNDDNGVAEIINQLLYVS